MEALKRNYSVATKEEANEISKHSSEDIPEEWPPWSHIVVTNNPHAPPPVKVKATPGPAWDIGQVLKAAQLLCKPPMEVHFTDEQEMRRVYSLIYDVFRYKSILEQAIDDTEFFDNYPELHDHRHTVWLFLMELARRQWGARSRDEIERTTKLLDVCGSPFKDVEKSIWDQRIHFAASIARIRIKNKAFSLSELLPPHLRDERVSACVNKDTVTGWVNIFKAKKVATLIKRLHELGYSYSNSKQLCSGEYRFDRVCPRFITLRPPEHQSIGQIDLVRNGIIVIQEREFCEGASTLCRALQANALRGVVAQTHASSPRCSAYLAAQLRDLAALLKAQTPAAPVTPELGKLVVFGAGDKVGSYVCALRELGIEASEAPQSGAPVYVLSEPVHNDTPTVINALDGVVAALATPPNSYSAVTDPIDLVCGRGGDLAMLEILTESQMDVNGKERVQSILEEQKKTLKALLSKPQIQLVLYETHSALEAENQSQVIRAVAEANRLARERHAVLKKKHRDHHNVAKVKETLGPEQIDSSSSLDTTDLNLDKVEEIGIAIQSSPTSTSKGRTEIEGPMLTRNEESISESRPGTTKARPIPEIHVPEDQPRDPDKDSANVVVPSCDLFEVSKLPNLGNGLDINYILDRDGCYLGLIQRKEITRLDAKYMIRVAEERGLFGGGSPTPAPVRRTRDRQAPEKKRSRRNSGFEVERVGAPTFASLTRSRRSSAPGAVRPHLEVNDDANESWPVCERHARRQAAASAITAAACICDARHRRRRVSDTPSPPTHAMSACFPACRRPFPVTVHDLRLTTVSPPYKIFAS